MSHPPLDNTEKELIGKLLRMRQGCDDKSQDEMLPYLKGEYEIIVRSSQQLSKFKKNTSGAGFEIKENIARWRTFIIKEQQLLSAELNGGGSFAVPYKFDYQSAIDLSRTAHGAARCIFFNTYININEWHNALIQMHLSIQKSIEQKNNQKHICNCHKSRNKDVGARQEHIDDCTNNPPTHRHYRVLLLPLTGQELAKLIESNQDGWKDRLEFSTMMHAMLSIQMAILTVTDMVVIMKNNPEFFSNTDNLKSLGLSEAIGESLRKDQTKQIMSLLKSDIERLGKIPDRESSTGIDFVYIEKDKKPDEHIIWSALFNEEGDGLSYFPIKDPQAAEIKKAFSEIVYSAITISASPGDYVAIHEFNPIHEFIKNSQTDGHYHVLPKYDPIHKTGLINVSFDYT